MLGIDGFVYTKTIFRMTSSFRHDIKGIVYLGKY